MTATFWLSTGQTVVRVARRALLAVVVGAVIGLGIYAFDAVLHMLGFHTQVIAGVVLCIVIVAGLMWWTAERLDAGVEEIRAIGDDLDERRESDRQMRDDVYAMRVAIGEWLDDVRDWMENWEEQPETQPHPIVGPDTVPESQAIRLIADVELAWEVARLEQIMRGDRPSPKRRSKV